MRYRSLGRTGLIVSELCLGTMTFGASEGRFKQIAGLGQDEANALVRAALDAGINFLDTANVYSDGASERITGQALRDLGIRRDDVVVATKAMGPMGSSHNARGASRFHLLDAIKASLDRLQLDHVDLYQIHGFDPVAPIEETVRALNTIVEQGHARYVGVSNWAAWQIMKALGIADKWGLARFVSLQAYYTVAGRDLERELVPLLEAEGLGLMVWSPLAGGLLSGKYRQGGGEGRRASFDFPPVDRGRVDRLIDLMAPMAEKRRVSIAQIALAWLLHRPVVTSVIIGAKRLDQLADNIDATKVSLDADELATLGDASKLAPEYPGWMFEAQGAYRTEFLKQR